MKLALLILLVIFASTTNGHHKQVDVYANMMELTKKIYVDTEEIKEIIFNSDCEY